MTFICELDLYSSETYRMYENELHMSRLLKVIVLQTGRQSRPKLYTSLRGWSIIIPHVSYVCVVLVCVEHHYTLVEMSYVCAYSSVQLDKSRVEKEFTEVNDRRAAFLPRCMQCRRGIVMRILSVRHTRAL